MPDANGDERARIWTQVPLLRGREDFFEKKLFGSPSDPESKNIVFIDTVQF